MRAGDYVRYIGPGPILVEPGLPSESMAQVERWVNNFRHGDHNCSTWLFRLIYPEMVPAGTIPTPILRKPYTYGLACDYEVVTYGVKQHLIEVERGLRVARKLMA